MILYFQVHQPRRLRNFSYFDIGSGDPYFDDDLNGDIVRRLARECYIPSNTLIRRLIEKNPGIRISFSISGTALEQFEEFAPEVIASFQELIKTGAVEILGETYAHSLSGLWSSDEFESQVADHREKVQSLFGVTPTVFRNTELIYNNDIGERVKNLGFTGMLIEGVSQALGSQSTWRIFHHPADRSFMLLPRSCGLSDDIGFRFERDSAKLTVDEYVSWMKGIEDIDPIVTIGLDYETFGEHKKRASGIFDFLEGLLVRLSGDEDFQMTTPSALVAGNWSAPELSIPKTVSWADHEKDHTAWLGNSMQREAFDLLMRFESDVKSLGDPAILTVWRWLQTSDHLYYISTKRFADGEVHAYFSPYSSPYEAFINYMNVLSDFKILIKAKKDENSSLSQAQVVSETERRQHSEPVWVEGIKENYLPH